MDHLDTLGNALNKQKAAATFACGGNPTSKFPSTNDGGTSTPSDPILFYESKDGQCHKIVFPTIAKQMEKLVSDCDPATFGVGNEDRLDVEYRSAWKLDNSKFASSFHPFDSDMMEVVKQLLFSGAVHLGVNEPVIVAELYKLNIYKGPDDKFKPHVDTPRRQNQFGSLVVCLPCAHTGGELVVRHDGRQVTFDWSNDSKSIQWAAFYSDCEHEVLPVTSGYRVTLTYNLYYNNQGGRITSPNWGITSLPLYRIFEQALQDKECMPQGGLLGVYCHHNYAHAANRPHERLPGMMKGADAALWAVCNAFKLHPLARPIYAVDEYCYQDEDNGTTAGVDTDWVGDSFTTTYEDRLGYSDEGLLTHLRDVDDMRECRGIRWLNKPNFHEPNFAYVTYGNEAGVGMLYSAAAILVHIPPWSATRGLILSVPSTEAQTA